MSAPLVLASASPRRRELLAAAGYQFEVVPSEIPEIPQTGEAPETFAQRIAREKAADVARRRPGAYVLGADTVVVVDGILLGKPTNRAEARRMLRALSGRAHRVLTGVALVTPAGTVDSALVESRVEFRALSASDIEAYLDLEEPYDKAGAYAVQGYARQFIAAVHGSYSNVVGLPMELISELLRPWAPATQAEVPPA
ncbi:MAG: maf protein [Deltaproteobacteria bacterium]|nr:maf protein [Deltaproteobacteria bacterium]